MMEEEKVDINQVSMEVILNAGDGRGCMDKAMEAVARFDFEGADEYVKQAEQKLLAAHRAQTSMIQRQAAGEDVEYSILFVHAQDTLMTIAAELHTLKGMLPVLRALDDRIARLESK
jgi:PTS system cellobiose-specific IIA component